MNAAAYIITQGEIYVPFTFLPYVAFAHNNHIVVVVGAEDFATSDFRENVETMIRADLESKHKDTYWDYGRLVRFQYLSPERD